MRSRVLFSAAALSLLLAHPASAAKSLSLGVSGGSGSPVSDFSDVAKPGYSVTGDVEYALAPSWGLGIDSGYQHFGVKNGTSDDKWQVIPVMADLKYTLPFKAGVQPYLKGSAGLDNLRYTVGTLDEKENKFGWGVGAGLGMRGSEALHVGVEATYDQIQTESKATSYVTAGLTLAWGMSKS